MFRPVLVTALVTWGISGLAFAVFSYVARERPPERAPAIARFAMQDGSALVLYPVLSLACPAPTGRVVNSDDAAGNTHFTGCWWRKDDQVGICWADGDCRPYPASAFTWMEGGK
jgi:hypothetical protein